MTVRVTYPGRIALLGEHCDWAGGASLVVPLAMGDDIEAFVKCTVTREGVAPPSKPVGDHPIGRCDRGSRRKQEALVVVDFLEHVE